MRALRKGRRAVMYPSDRRGVIASENGPCCCGGGGGTNSPCCDTHFSVANPDDFNFTGFGSFYYTLRRYSFGVFQWEERVDVSLVAASIPLTDDGCEPRLQTPMSGSPTGVVVVESPGDNSTHEGVGAPGHRIATWKDARTPPLGALTGTGVWFNYATGPRLLPAGQSWASARSFTGTYGIALYSTSGGVLKTGVIDQSAVSIGSTPVEQVVGYSVSGPRGRTITIEPFSFEHDYRAPSGSGVLFNYEQAGDITISMDDVLLCSGGSP